MLEAPVPDWDTGKYAVLVTVLAAEAAYVINTRFRLGGVMGSGIASLVGGLLLPALFPDMGSTLAAACACGSYAGMSGRDRIPNEWFMAIAGVIAGLMFIWGSRCRGGIGGDWEPSAWEASLLPGGASGYTRSVVQEVRSRGRGSELTAKKGRWRYYR